MMRQRGSKLPARAEWRALPYVDDPAPWRRLAVRLLLDAAAGAYAKDPLDLQWINGPDAHNLAAAVDLPAWPPTRAQLSARAGLRARYYSLNKNAATRARREQAAAQGSDDD